MPKPDFDVVIYIVEDNIEAEFLYNAVDDYNRNYPDYKFIADHGKQRHIYKIYKQVTENTI